MKKLFLLLAATSMLFTACKKGGDDVNGGNNQQPGGPGAPEEAYIELSKESITFAPDGGSVDVTVYCNYEWSISETCDWCRASVTSGEAAKEGTVVTLTADLTYDNREGSITFSCNEEEQVLVVSQSLKETIIADENNTFNVAAEGGAVEIAYQANVECEVIIPEEAQSWISITPTETRGLVSGKTLLNIAKNDTSDKRSAVVKVAKKNDSSIYAEYTITQEYSDSGNEDNVILYTTTDGKTITPKFTHISNTYENGQGKITLDASVTSIGYNAFGSFTTLKSIVIPDTITEIGEYAFYGCSSLESVTIPNSVTKIDRYAFKDCTALKSITVPNKITIIDRYVFQGCSSLESVTIPNSVTEIALKAFNGCSNLTSITIPESVTKMGNYVLWECYSLRTIYCKATTPPTGGSDMFPTNVTDFKIYVPAASVDAYKAATKWSNYASDIHGYNF